MSDTGAFHHSCIVHYFIYRNRSYRTSCIRNLLIYFSRFISNSHTRSMLVTSQTLSSSLRRHNFIKEPFHKTSSIHQPRNCLNRIHAVAKNETHLTPFLRNEITETFTQIEHVPEPLWATWCGTVGGVWVGTYSAFNPVNGRPEPVALGDDNKTKVYALQQCCVEEREIIDDTDVMVRKTAYATSVNQLEKEMAAGGALRFDNTESVSWQTEELVHGQEGMFIFDGGTYSAGPVFLTEDQEEEEEDGFGEEETEQHYLETTVGNDDIQNMLARSDQTDDLQQEQISPSPGTTTVIEHALQYGGEKRVRIRITLSSSLFHSEGSQGTHHNRHSNNNNGNNNHYDLVELDVDLIRVSISLENWEGAPGKYTSPKQGEGEKKDQQTSALQRMRPEDLTGFWNVFEVYATMAQDIDLRTGQPAMIPVYNSKRVQRLVQATLTSLTENTAADECGYNEDEVCDAGVCGGTLWLPHNIALQLTQGGASSGLELTTVWKPEEGVVMSVTRKYDQEGVLQEVVSSTMIPAQ